MTVTKPMVSVILPVYNAVAFLTEAVASVRAQNYEPLEIIIIDDGSTDDTAARVAELGQGIRYIYQTNAGPASARNTGIEAAQGEVIAFIDADDLWPAGKLDLQVGRLQSDPTLQIVLGRIEQVLLTEDAKPYFHSYGIEGETVNLLLGCGVYRRTTFTRIGFFNTAMRYAEDVDWIFRALEADLRLTILKEVTLIYRLHDTNMTRNRRMSDFYMFKALKNSLERRKQPDGTFRRMPNFFQFDEGRHDLSNVE